jgi:hypothetical protein
MKKVEIKHFKVLQLPISCEPNAIYYVLDSLNNKVKTFITDSSGIPIPLIDLTGMGIVQSVTGTGVSGTINNPEIDIVNFVSSELGNLVKLSNQDGKLKVNKITSPDLSLEIINTPNELQIEIANNLLEKINNALQPEDITQYTNEDAQDAVGNIFVDTTTIDLTYNDTTPEISASVKANSITTSELSAGVNTSLNLANTSVQPINIQNFFNKLLDNSDSIIEGTTKKFTTTTEKNFWDAKQENLVSGTNIKTINGNSVLGAGDITLITDISGKEDVANKQNSLVVDGTGIKYPTVDAVNAGLITIPTLQSVLNAGNYAELDNGQSWIDVLGGNEYYRVFNVALYSGNGVNNSTEFYLTPTDINFYNSGTLKEGGMNVNSGEIYLFSKNKTLNQTTSLRFANPIAGSTLFLPAKATSGNYTLATLDDIPTPLDISSKEDIANKQNSLAADGTGIKYPTVDAVNAGLVTKVSIAGDTMTGHLQINASGTGEKRALIIQNNLDEDFRQAITVKAGNTTNQRRYFEFQNNLGVRTNLLGFNAQNGFIAFDSTLSYHFLTANSGGASSFNSYGTNQVRINADEGLTGTNGMAIYNGTANPSASAIMYNFSSAQMVLNGGRNIQIQSPDNIQHLRLFATNASTNIFSTLATRFYNTANIFSFSDSALNEKIRIDLTGGNTSLVIGATTAGARLDLRSQGDLSTDIVFRVRNSANTLNLFSVAGNGEVIASSTISASPATLSNQVVVKSQLDLKQDIITNPITGTGTLNTSTRWTGTNTQGNGSFIDDGLGNVSLVGDGKSLALQNNGGANYALRLINTTAAGFSAFSVKGGPNVTSAMLGIFGQRDNGELLVFNAANAPIAFSTNSVQRGQFNANGLDVTGKITATVAPTNANDVVRKTELDLKANLASPALTGTPTAPTATAGTNTTQIATTAFVNTELATKQNTITGTTNVIPKFGTGGVVASSMTDTGNSVTFNSSINVTRSSNTNNPILFPSSVMTNSLATIGDGTTTFNMSRHILQSGNGTVDVRLSSEFNSTFSGGTIGTNSAHGFRILTQGLTRINTFSDGRVVIGSGANNGVDALQINGTASASPATLSNQVVVKSQLDLKADLALTPIQLKDFFVDANNVGITETDLYTYTTLANRLNTTGEKIVAVYGGELKDATASSQLKVYFAGQVIGDTGVLTMSVAGAFVINVSIIRTGTTTARSILNISTPGASTSAYTKYTSLTGLTFSNTNILKITGTAGGATGGNDDITATYGNIQWQPAAI